MTTQIKRRRGTTVEHASFTGAEGEITIDTTKDTVVVHDGSTAGGHPLAKENGSTFTNVDINSGTIDNAVIGGSTAAAGTFTTLTATGNVVLGDAATDTVTITADVASDLIPSADGTYDLGASGSEWQDLFIDGTANIDSLVADTADINGGTIDGTTIGGASAAAGTFTSITGTQFSSDATDVELKYSGSTKLATTNTGIAVTGTVTVDGLTLNNEGDTITFDTSGSPKGRIKTGDTVLTNSLQIEADNGITLNSGQDDSGLSVDSVVISRGSTYTKTALFDPNGDISFYEDTGTTPKLFWDASAESLGIGYSGANLANTKLALGDTSASNSVLQMYSASTGLNTIRFGDAANSDPASFSGYIQYSHASDFMRFATATGERMRIDSSGNVGIGNTSTGYTFTSGETRLAVGDGSEHATVQLYSGATKWGGISFTDNTTNGSNQGLVGYYHPDNYMQFNTNGVEAMRITSAGNVGIGTTTPTNTSGLEIQTSSTTAGLWVQTGGTTSSYTIADFRTGTNLSALSVLGNGNSIFQGNVGIGTTSPAEKLHIGGSVGDIKLKSSGAEIEFTRAGLNVITASNASGYLTFSTGGTNERMRIDSSGNVAIGTSSPDSSTRLHVVASGATASTNLQNGIVAAFERSQSTAGSYLAIIGANNGASALLFGDTDDDDVGNIFYDHSSNFMAFDTGTAEAMRIDINGNLLVGTTSTGPVNANAITIEPNNSRIRVAHSGTANATPYIQFDYNGTNIGSITQATTTTVAYNTSSDARLKENIVDASSASDVIDAIQVRAFDWKADGSHQRYGMVAQELLEVAPEAVSAPEDPDAMMGVDYSKLVPMLVKEIQDLRKRIAILESN